MFGIEIVFKNGQRDWIDPVEDEPVEDDGVLTVTRTTGRTYEYALDDIDVWFKYDLCKHCEYDVRTYGCNGDDCINPRQCVYIVVDHQIEFV